MGLLPVILAIALAPGGGGGRACSFRLPDQLAPWHDDQRLLNVLFFLPVAALSTLAVRATRHYLYIFSALVALAIAIEMAQTANVVSRSCDVADLLDNSLGIAIGVVLGWIGAVGKGRPRWLESLMGSTS